MSLYEVVYGQKPPLVPLYLLGTYNVEEVDHALDTRVSSLSKLKDNLVSTQNKMKQQPDKHSSKCSLDEGN
jgi:hypothetical protein